MGLPADQNQDPFELHNDCGLLIPHLWETGMCPWYITAIFNGIEACPDYEPWFETPIPNSIPIILTQNESIPCMWSALHNNWGIMFHGDIFGLGNSGLSLIDYNTGGEAFLGYGPTQTETAWVNRYVFCYPPYCGIRGEGMIY